MHKIDKLIDQVTMYRLLIYYLLGLIIVAFFLGLFRDITYNPISILVSAGILVGANYIINKIFASMFDAPSASESAIITGLILCLIISPTLGLYNILFLLAASGLAQASKYLITYKNKHIFNPAAIAVVLTAFGPKQSASWWIGTGVILPFVIIGGILILRKINRIKMFLYYFIATTLSTIFYAILSKVSVATSIHDMIFSSAVFFLGFVMLTEPLTSPPTSKKQNIYAIIVGFLLPPQVHFGSFYTTPEISLIIGNIYSFIVSPKGTLLPRLKQKLRISSDSVDFIFEPDKKINYSPGQYMEWTIPHENTDSRGNRRIFTLASSPTEPDLRIGIKFYNNGSSFKEAIMQINRNSLVSAHQIAGDFTLPKTKNEKLVFIAGGIGITPFRSMVKYLMDTNQRRDIVLFYSVKNESDLAYKEVFDRAKKELGIKVIYVLTGKNTTNTRVGEINGRINYKLIQEYVSDFENRTFYISGTSSMVGSIKKQLKGIGVLRSRIKSDEFSGY